MLLTIDVGNTDTVIGVFVDAPLDGPRVAPDMPGLVHHWRVQTLSRRTADEHALLLAELLSLAGIGFGKSDRQRAKSFEHHIGGVAISSSVPSVTAALRDMAREWLDIPFVVVEPGIKTGMPILYENPREVGADRIVNAVGALDLYGAPAIVVDLGTATTFDAISAKGEYLGGAIVPGIEISMDALVSRAAALRKIELVEPRAAIGRTTIESMQSGAIFGYAALVDGLCARIIAELGEATVIATGGLSSLIAPYAHAVQHLEPWLTLHGLRRLYEKNVEEQMSK